jgi:hypothetical protein
MHAEQNVLAKALKFQIEADELAEFIRAHPTSTSDLKYTV